MMVFSLSSIVLRAVREVSDEASYVAWEGEELCSNCVQVSQIDSPCPDINERSNASGSTGDVCELEITKSTHPALSGSSGWMTVSAILAMVESDGS